MNTSRGAIALLAWPVGFCVAVACVIALAPSCGESGSADEQPGWQGHSAAAIQAMRDGIAGKEPIDE